jgi:hypothetical protein
MGRLIKIRNIWKFGVKVEKLVLLLSILIKIQEGIGVSGGW